ncbi:hypothetical protein [Rhodospira trueperi]|uniref:Uncharacterized protein n=1 Tax=Rhodospira trueperi TaxID=69960 RepID=A0A1G6WZM3_9PROT|nr:hypothetical protein [Rhodospira trueperi]SDD71420.1 hypothetical protein SAMN05421720_101327 [Rhodospira trueperi]
MLVNGTASGASTLAFVAPGGTRSSQTSLNSGTNPLVAVVKASDPAQADTLEDDLALSKEAVARLETAEKEMREARKNAAREKVARLKAQLQALRMLAVSDPEAAAREAARLARELAAAVRAYVSAGGDASEAANATGATTSTNAAASSGGDDPSASASESTTTDAAAPSDDDAAAAERVSVPGTQTEDMIKTTIAKMNAEAAERKADTDFANDARLVLNALKAIIENAQRRKDEGTGRAALLEVEQALGQLQGTLTGQTTDTDPTLAVPSISLLV